MLKLLILIYINVSLFFFFNDTATTEIYTLSLHDALPTLTMPASVSSLETITRASLSSCLTPSAWMGPARMTRGFMALLSEGEGHLHDSERRIGLEGIALARVGEPPPLVQSRGGAVT